MEFLVHASLHQREDAVPCVGLEVSQRAEISEVERPVAECFDGGVVVCGNDQIDRLGDGFRQVIAKELSANNAARLRARKLRRSQFSGSAC